MYFLGIYLSIHPFTHVSMFLCTYVGCHTDSAAAGDGGVVSEDAVVDLQRAVHSKKREAEHGKFIFRHISPLPLSNTFVPVVLEARISHGSGPMQCTPQEESKTDFKRNSLKQ